jgi:RNA polymerase sigma-70 factor (ECF subfamily)
MTQSISWGGTQDSLSGEDADLVVAAQQNPAEFKRLYQKWLKPVYRYFYFRLGNEKDAEDLTSQVFLKAYEDLPRYRSRGQFSAWLFSIAHARTVDYYRKGSREVALENANLVSAAPDLLNQAVRNSEVEQLFYLLSKLDEDEQELIRLRFAADLGYREIGQILHRSEEAVRKSISRLLDRLQIQLEENDD